MVIICPQCGTKFRFDEKKMELDGIWARCSRCHKVFFQRKTPAIVKGEALPLDADEQQIRHVLPPDVDHQTSEGDNGAIQMVTETADDELEGESGYKFQEEDEPAHPPQRPKGINLWTPGKITAYISTLILVLGGVYLSIFPEVGKHLVGKTPLAAYLGIQIAGNPAGSGIDLVNVQERFIENRMVGAIMVIQGLAVNKNNYPVSKLQVKAKLLDAAGEFTAESAAYCGVLLSEEELANLTEKEIRSELSNSQGRSIPNSNIIPEGNIPFMIVFNNAPQKATDYIVEVAALEKPIR